MNEASVEVKDKLKCSFVEIKIRESHTPEGMSRCYSRLQAFSFALLAASSKPKTRTYILPPPCIYHREQHEQYNPSYILMSITATSTAGTTITYPK
jgi:hypothetical protein